MTLAERDVCRVAMRDNLALNNFVSQRLELLLVDMDFDDLGDLMAYGVAWEMFRRAYIQGMKDGYQATQGKCEKMLFRDREDKALNYLSQAFRRETNPDYVSATDVCKVDENISLAYRQGVKEGQLPLGALAL